MNRREKQAFFYLRLGCDVILDEGNGRFDFTVWVKGQQGIVDVKAVGKSLSTNQQTYAAAAHGQRVPYATLKLLSRGVWFWQLCCDEHERSFWTSLIDRCNRAVDDRRREMVAGIQGVLPWFIDPGLCVPDS